MSQLPNPTIVFDDIPLPPSSNAAYKSFVRGGKIRHVCHPDLVAFKRDFGLYQLSNLAAFRLAESVLKEPKGRLGIHCSFFVGSEKLMTKKGKLKRWDVSNRLKALHDCLAEALGIDDSLFMDISASKYVMPEKTRPSVRVELSFQSA